MNRAFTSIAFLTLMMVGLATTSGCGSSSKDTVAPEQFAPRPPSDTSSGGGSGTSGGDATNVTTAEG